MYGKCFYFVVVVVVVDPDHTVSCSYQIKQMSFPDSCVSALMSIRVKFNCVCFTQTNRKGHTFFLVSLEQA